MPIELTPAHWSQLKKVNSAVNLFSYISDMERYHKPEFWEQIDRKGGDCEDYALEKRARLIQLGWPIEDLKLCVCTLDGVGHCVLTVDTTSGTYVLDNNSSSVLPWAKADYKWVMRQQGTAWVAFGGGEEK